MVVTQRKFMRLWMDWVIRFAFLLTSGQVQDSRVAQILLDSLDISDSNVMVDKAYGTAELR